MKWKQVHNTSIISCVKVNTLRPGQNGRRFADDTFKRIFLNENFRILIKISLKFVPKGPINNNPALVQIMAWRRPGDKPLSEPMMVCSPTHICVTRPQWVNIDMFCFSNPCQETLLQEYSRDKALMGFSCHLSAGFTDLNPAPRCVSLLKIPLFWRCL